MCSIIFFSLTFSFTEIKIKSPKSRTKLESGSIYKIKWKPYNKKNQQDKVKIYFSPNNGSDWEFVAITENDGQYNWEVSSIISDKCLIKIENYDGTERGVSKKPFTIDGPFISIIYPEKGAIFSGGEKAKLAWKSNKIGNELINIYYSIDNGLSWFTISERMVDTGIYLWDIPHLDNIYTDCYIKIQTNSGKAIQRSEKFTIVNESNKIQIFTPNGGELIEAKSRFKINWKANGLKSDLFKIMFSTNNGATWERVESRVLNANEYLWKVPDIESDQCKIKIIAVENEKIYDVSEQVFTISKLSKLKIANPHNNQNYYSDDSIDINWSVINVRGKKVNIYFSRDKGLTWNVIGRAIPNLGKFLWSIPSFDTTSYNSKIKVELSSNIKINDVSDGNFVLYGKPEIKINSPQQQNLILEDKSTFKIVWHSKNIRENRINLYYSDNNGNTWKAIAKDISNKGFYNWVIPSLNTIDCIFKVESSVQPEVSSISKHSIKITEKALIIIENNLNAMSFTALDSLELNWQSYNLKNKYLDLLLSIDNGKNWITIKSNFVDFNKLKIALPFISKSSRKCKIKLVESSEDDHYDISQGSFTILRPKGTLNILPNVKNTYQYYDQKKIVWDSEYLNDKAGQLSYSLDDGKSWINLEKIDLKVGNYIWDIPNLEEKSDQCRIKIDVIDADLNYINNIKKFSIEAAPLLSINNNINDTVKTNMPFMINTSIKNIDEKSYNLYYSLSNGISWTQIANRVNNSNFLWNVPSIKGFKNILLKAELIADKEIADIKKYRILEQSINLTLLKPNGDEKFKVGEEIEIVWSIKKIYDKTIDIFYSIDGGNSWVIIEKSAPNSGKYKWLISDNINTSSTCKVKVQSNISQNIFDISDGMFLIDGIVKSFNIITPNGGDLIYAGTSTFIYWESIKNETNNVDLYYSVNNGKDWILIQNNVENNGVYNWVVPPSIKYSDQCLVKIISSKNPKHSGMSDNTFTIKTN